MMRNLNDWGLNRVQELWGFVRLDECNQVVVDPSPSFLREWGGGEEKKRGEPPTNLTIRLLSSLASHQILKSSMQPPLQSSRSYTRPIQPPAPPPTDFDPSSSSNQRRPSHASTRTTTQDDWDPRLSMRRTSSSGNTSQAQVQAEKPQDWAADEESSTALSLSL